MEICHSAEIHQIINLFNELPKNLKHDTSKILRKNAPISPSTTKKRKFNDEILFK